jgi:hypothetical protein
VVGSTPPPQETWHPYVPNAADEQVCKDPPKPETELFKGMRKKLVTPRRGARRESDRIKCLLVCVSLFDGAAQ